MNGLLPLICGIRALLNDMFFSIASLPIPNLRLIGAIRV